MSKLALVVTIEPKPGQREAVLEALKAHAARSLSGEPGTLQFDVLVPVDEDNKLMLYEMYVDEAAFGCTVMPRVWASCKKTPRARSAARRRSTARCRTERTRSTLVPGALCAGLSQDPRDDGDGLPIAVVGHPHRTVRMSEGTSDRGESWQTE